MAVDIKTPEEMEVMAEGGARLRRVKNALAKAVKIGVTGLDIENLAMKLIKEEGAEPSFTKVENYKWATCISVNEGIVHGIPKKETIFKKGDLVSVDVGIFYKGFHTDTSISVGLELTPENAKFLETGKTALKKAIREAKAGKYIFDISRAMEDVVVGAGYTPLRALVGHGVGRELHEEPQIPCFVPREARDVPPTGSSKGAKIVPGMVLAIEVMYTQGKPDIGVMEDGWTIVMRDGKISALFEETVCVTTKGPQVIT